MRSAIEQVKAGWSVALEGSKMLRTRRKIGALVVAAVILAASAAVLAQDDSPAYQLSPDARLPALGPDRLRVTPPQPSVRVTGDDGSPLRRRHISPSTLELQERENLSRERIEQNRLRTAPDRPPRSSSTPSTVPATDPDRMTMRRAPGRSRRGRARSDERPQLGRLIVMTGYPETRVTVDGQPYPSNSMQGVLLYAGEEYEVVLERSSESSSSSSRSRAASSGSEQYRVIPVRVAAGETRILMANVGGETSGRASSRARTTERRSSTRSRADEDDEDEDSTGFLGVSSSPRGIVYVDGENTGQMTPARRIELEPGRHEVRIFYESEDRFSETKNVLIRSGVNTNVFFRLRRDELEDEEEDGDDDR